MVVCPACGQQNPSGARFCFACATPLAPTTERRKLATVLFCDIAGSTALGERVDPEAVREIMHAYFGEMGSAVAVHGGTVEKFIGDAVMAVFGVPIAHENDALRAVRAAWQMRDAMERLNADLQRRYGLALALRIGINTGEVVAGDVGSRQELVTGDAVNVAARLEQAAQPGQIVIGPTTARLVRDGVSLRPLNPLHLKGKAEPLAAFAVEDVPSLTEQPARQFATPMIGRRAELERLSDELHLAGPGRSSLVTVIGEPGVGKSRIAAEVVAAALDRHRVLASRCLPYGEGITYWPLADVVRQAAGISDEQSRAEALAYLQSICGEDEARVIAQAIGLTEGTASKEAIGAAFVALFRSLADRQPLLLFIDDIQWAEAVLLDFLRALPDALDPAPVGVLCLARPELVEDRPDWPVTVRLAPLSVAESSEFMVQMLGEGELPTALSERIATAAAGNPLFLEELVGMLVDDGLVVRTDGRWRVTGDLAALLIPTSLRELLGARLDRLPGAERSALERGSVEGQIFHDGAVAELSDDGDRSAVRAALLAVRARDVIRVEEPRFAGEAAFAFRHVLIRDAAYDAMPKRLRSRLHERFAGWLETKAGDRTAEHDEILGYHLEQSFQYREQLGNVSSADLAIAARAAEHLTTAGGRAFARRDADASVNLFTRAVALMPANDSRRLELLRASSHMLIDGNQLIRGGTLLAALIDEATSMGDSSAAAQARLLQLLVRFTTEPDFGPAGMRSELEAITASLGRLDDQRVRARIHDTRAFVHDQLREFASVEDEAKLAIECARRAQDRSHELEMYWYLLWALPRGPEPVESALGRVAVLLEEIGDDRAAVAQAECATAELEAFIGRFDEARRRADSALATMTELGLWVFVRRTRLVGGQVELLAGDAISAERTFRAVYDELRTAGDLETLASSVCLLAESLCELGRFDEAEELSIIGSAAAPRGSVLPAAKLRCVRARARVRAGHVQEALSLVGDALTLTAQSDDLNLRASIWLAQADVLAVAREADAASRAAAAAVGLFEQKGNTVMAARTQVMFGLHPAE
jgi:class 3 adenylate cyclase/tetratricopeptide (TPR) repeat protein